MTIYPKILKVTVHETGSKSAPFRYTAHHESGTTTVIRNATRLYANAFQYQDRVCSGPSGLASFFTFGKAPGSQTAQLVATFPVERIVYDQSACEPRLD